MNDTLSDQEIAEMVKRAKARTNEFTTTSGRPPNPARDVLRLAAECVRLTDANEKAVAEAKRQEALVEQEIANAERNAVRAQQAEGRCVQLTEQRDEAMGHADRAIAALAAANDLGEVQAAEVARLRAALEARDEQKPALEHALTVIDKNTPGMPVSDWNVFPLHAVLTLAEFVRECLASATTTLSPPESLSDGAALAGEDTPA